MTILDVIKQLEGLAPPVLQESYDNAGLIVGDQYKNCTGIIISLDCIEGVVQEAIDRGCNLIVSHHPIVFKGLKTITGKNYVERTIISAIKNDIAIYAIHTNLDNVLHGVNKVMAERLGLQNLRILAPKHGLLRKIAVFVPMEHELTLAKAMHQAGAGSIGNYSECSFSSQGEGRFTPGIGTNPFVGSVGSAEKVLESKLEMIYPYYLESAILSAMNASHPYEVVAYDIYDLHNTSNEIGSGLVGELKEKMNTDQFLEFVKERFAVKTLKHTALCHKEIKTVALCGGAGSFLLPSAIGLKSDIYISADFKYNEFFDADGKIIIADIGHFESEQFTIDLLYDFLSQKFTTFAVLKTAVNTNPVTWL